MIGICDPLWVKNQRTQNNAENAKFPQLMAWSLAQPAMKNW